MEEPRFTGNIQDPKQTAFPCLPFQPELLSDERQLELLALSQRLQSMQPLPPGELRRPVYQEADKQELPVSIPGVIGLAGKPRSGKDVAADFLEAHYFDVCRVNFSDPIIQEVNQWLQPSGHAITQGNKSQHEYRSLLQAWGMARREENASYWVDSLRSVIQQLHASGAKLVLVCGVRALSDLELVEELGGECWLVERPGNDYQAEHAIENSLAQIPRERFCIIGNSAEGDLAPYQASIQKTLARFI